MTDLAKLRELYEKATLGEWKVCGGYTPAYSAINSPAGFIIYGMADKTVDTEHGHLIDAPSFDAQRANIQFIVALHNAFPAIATELDQLRTECERLRRDAERYRVGK